MRSSFSHERHGCRCLRLIGSIRLFYHLLCPCWLIPNLFILKLTFSFFSRDISQSQDSPVPTPQVHEQVVTPWDVQGSVSTDGSQQAINYDKLIDQFGTRRIDDKVLERFEKLIGRKPHIFLRRGLFFSHRLAFFYFF
jgi:hypothetical protein